MLATKKRTACYGCDALVPDLPGKPHPYIGANAGCWQVYGQVLAREYGEYGYPQPTHCLTVDTYAVQHPGQPGPQAIRSVSAHLASLCLLLEHGLSADLTAKRMVHLLKHASRLEWLEPPVPNGRITILDIARAPDVAVHRVQVADWARDVWVVWAPHHHIVRSWLQGVPGIEIEPPER